jgi:L-threonylcarbamoyladenylate synthase
MKQTAVYTVNPESPEADKIEAAAAIIKSGGLVAFPTETVYGLGADALNADAVLAMFAAKNRPLDNPPIIHVQTLRAFTSLPTRFLRRRSC